MKIAIISDNHGGKGYIDRLFQMGGFDYLFYLGDGIENLGTYKYLDNVYAVSGNCDFFSTEPNEQFFTLDGTRFFITHGNKYGVKYSMDSLITRAKEIGANIVCFGHTHRVFMEEKDGVLFLNPGSFKAENGVASGLVLDIENGKYSISTLRVKQGND